LLPLAHLGGGRSGQHCRHCCCCKKPFHVRCPVTLEVVGTENIISRRFVGAEG
jgi:hypothetical protein